MSESPTAWVEVVYALPERQFRRRLPHVAGLSVEAAVAASGVLEAWPELRASILQFAIYGEPVGPERLLQAGERVELLRPLRVDPREARRRRLARSAGGPGRRRPG
jgi:putative ubiquitin-RnfH superfamily antitoxin RatB of RatAB toxin-antitoxin module